jgi:hypothetical protein
MDFSPQLISAGPGSSRVGKYRFNLMLARQSGQSGTKFVA